MNWINPREKLPKEEQLIWVLCIEHKDENGPNPCAKIEIAEAGTDIYGIAYAEVINHKGYPMYTRHFYDFRNSYSREINEFEERPYCFDSDSIIFAWLPFEDIDLPSWNSIDFEEAKEIIHSMKSYQEECARQKNLPEYGNYFFVSLKEAKPRNHGVYAVVNKKGIWLTRYDKDTCLDPWISPNGDPVEGWYPIPDPF